MPPEPKSPQQRLFALIQALDTTTQLLINNSKTILHLTHAMTRHPDNEEQRLAIQDLCQSPELLLASQLDILHSEQVAYRLTHRRNAWRRNQRLQAAQDYPRGHAAPAPYEPDFPDETPDFNPDTAFAAPTTPTPTQPAPIQPKPRLNLADLLDAQGNLKPTFTNSKPDPSR